MTEQASPTQQRALELVERARRVKGESPDEQQRILAEVQALREALLGPTYLIPNGTRYKEGPGRAPKLPRRRKEGKCRAGGECLGSGWLLDRRGEAIACRCQVEASKRRLHRFLGGNLSPSLEAPPLDQLPREVFEKIRSARDRLQAGEPVGLWLHGPQGSRRTTAAVLLAEAAMASDLSVRFFPLTELLGRLRRLDGDRRRKDEPDLISEIEALASIDVLIIDDVDGKELLYGAMTNEDGQEETPRPRQLLYDDIRLLFMVVDERAAQGAPLIMTSSSAPSDFADALARTSRQQLFRSLIRTIRDEDPHFSEEEAVSVQANQIAGRLSEICPTRLGMVTE